TDHRPPTNDQRPTTNDDDDLPVTLSPCHLVTLSDHALLISELRAFLADRLPDYMVPADFVLLDALPLNRNGKIDRKALPAPELTRSDSSGAIVAPRTPSEEVLAGIWAEVLGVERVGIHDNFVEIGGHSLRATQVISR